MGNMGTSLQQSQGNLTRGNQFWGRVNESERTNQLRIRKNDSFGWPPACRNMVRGTPRGFKGSLLENHETPGQDSVKIEPGWREKRTFAVHEHVTR